MGLVQGKRCRRRVGTVEQTFLDHDPRAVVPLLAGLEHEEHRAGERLTTAREQPRGAHQHRRVTVVPARVHRAFDFRRERQAGLLGHRQGVHVATKQNRPAGAGARQTRDHRRRALARPDLEPETVERLEDRLLRPRHRESDLRMTVDPATQLDHVVQHGLRVVEKP